jgi:uncharacterized YigZ family protein
VADRFLTLAGEHRYQPAPIKNSRFIACVAPAADEPSAAAFVARIAQEFDDARHACWAWRLGEEGALTRSNDDGEPSGSAGRPILLQLEGHGVVNSVAVVVRYFGGVKLGVGGLMRAYGGAAGQCLDRATLREVVVTERVSLVHGYEASSAVQAVLAAHGISPAEAEYGERVRLVLDVPRADLPGLREELLERTGGRVALD